MAQATVVVDSLWEVVQLSLLKVRFPWSTGGQFLQCIQLLQFIICAAVVAGHQFAGLSRGHRVAAQ